MKRVYALVFAPVFLFLAACETSQQNLIIENTGITPRSGSVDNEPTRNGSEITEPLLVVDQQLIADLLYEALQALDDNRLTTPIDDNAHSRFSRVLAYQPDNQMALQGIQDIVTRYLTLASGAAVRGQFDSAERLIERARSVDENHPDLAPALQKLQQERQSTDKFYDLNVRELAAQSESIREQLKEIGVYARDNESFIFITAPTDGQARWVYLQMQEAVEGYRLRANIEIADVATVRLIKQLDSSDGT